MERAGLADELEELLNSYLGSSGEQELSLASELGRRAAGLGVLPEELLAAHVTAMQRVLRRLPLPIVADGVERSYQMLLEAFIAYFVPSHASVSSPPADAVERADTRSAAGLPREAAGLQARDREPPDRAAQFRELVEVGNALIGAPDLPRALEPALKRAMELTGGAAGMVWLLDESGNLVTQTGHTGTAAADLEPLARRAIDEGRPLVGERRPDSNAGITEFALPLISPPGTLVGVLTVLLPDNPERQAGDEFDLLQLLASQLGAVIANAKLYQAVAEHEQALHALVGRLITAQDDERRRVAYDIHDGLAQTTVVTFQQLQLLAGSYHPRSPQARAYLKAALVAGQRAVTEARQLIAGLRPTILDDFGLSAAIAHEVEALRGEGREVTYENNVGGERFPAALETTLYHVTQEALTNVRKHAGPSPVRVTLERADAAIRLEIRDWGRGFEPARPDAARGGQEVGVASMRERLALVQGSFTITWAPGEGTVVVAVAPLARP
ncbi:MAG: hypothetical protein EPO16_10975 [Dehalococcoidia bacterium]|nr:MAG: hypothetical protein EPO16_10975 [Dehalococcoidia bacterium]